MKGERVCIDNLNRIRARFEFSDLDALTYRVVGMWNYRYSALVMNSLNCFVCRQPGWNLLAYSQTYDVAISRAYLDSGQYDNLRERRWVEVVMFRDGDAIQPLCLDYGRQVFDPGVAIIGPHRMHV
jgi:hypothetical protein